MGSELIQLRRSPYIDRPIDNTALEAYTQCEWKFFASMVQHRRHGGAPSPAIAAGAAWHKMMEVHYKTGGDRDLVMATLMACWEPHDKPDDHRTPERLRTVYDQYISYWGDHATDTRNNGSTVGYPAQPLVEIPVELGWEISDARTGIVTASGTSPLQTPVSASLHPYTGKLDRIIEWQGLYYIEDHKSTAQPGGDGPRFSSAFFDQFDPSNQMMGYAWLAQKLTGLPITGVRINGVGWLKTKTKFDRQIIPYTQQRLADWAENYNLLIERVEKSYRLLKEGAPPEIAFPRTWRCSQKYGMCFLKSVCATNPQRRMQVLESEYEVKPWNPMEATGVENDAEV